MKKEELLAEISKDDKIFPPRHVRTAFLIISSLLLGVILMVTLFNALTTNMPQPTQITTTITTEEKIKQDIRLVLGANTNRDVKKIRSIDVLEYEGYSGERILVNVNYNADDNLFGTGGIKRGIWMDDIKVFKKLYSTYPKIRKVGMMAYFPLTDLYGNAKDALVSNIVLDKKTAERINWDNLITDNLPKIADKIEEHPALKT